MKPRKPAPKTRKPPVKPRRAKKNDGPDAERRAAWVRGELAELRDALRAAEELKCLNSCERAVKGGHPGALFEALHWCEQGNIFPAWVSRVAQEALRELFRGPKPGARPARVRWNRHLRDLKDYVRWSEVESARDHGLIFGDVGREGAYDFASKFLADTEAGGTPAAMKRSWKLVQRTNKSEPWRYYLALGSQRTLDRYSGIGPYEPRGAGHRAIKWALAQPKTGRRKKIGA